MWQISQWDVLKVGLPVTIVSLIIATAYLIVVWVGIAGYH
jgi:Na+/H+ antiporter NhaD/arsenite permease-like protein